MRSCKIFSARFLKQSGGKHALPEIPFIQLVVDNNLVHSLKFRKPELPGHEAIDNIAIAGFCAQAFDGILDNFFVVKGKLG